MSASESRTSPSRGGSKMSGTEMPGDLHDHGCKFFQVDPFAVRHIVRTLCIALHGPEVCLHDIFYITEIPGLSAVTINYRRHVVQYPGNEIRDHGGIRGVRVLAGTKDIEIPEGNGLQTIDPGKDPEVLLAGQF